MFVHAQSIGRVSRPVFSECTLPSLVLWWRMQHRGLKASEGRHCRGVEPLDFSRIRQIAECSRLLAQSRLPLYLVSIIEYVYCLNMVEKHCQNYHHRLESIRINSDIFCLDIHCPMHVHIYVADQATSCFLLVCYL